MGAANTTICIYYTRDRYTLTLNEGSYISSVSGGGTYKVDQTVTATAVVGGAPEGYSANFKEWKEILSPTLSTTVSTSRSYIFKMPARNVALKAYGEMGINSYALTVKHYLENTDNNYFTLDNNYEIYTITHGTNITLANYARNIDGMEYSYGSLTGSNTGGTATSSKTINGNTTIYLYYTKKMCTVTCVIDGVTYPPKKVPYGTPTSELTTNTPTKERKQSSTTIGTVGGYTISSSGPPNSHPTGAFYYYEYEFVGWIDPKVSSSNYITTINSDCTLHALFMYNDIEFVKSLSAEEMYTFDFKGIGVIQTNTRTPYWESDNNFNDGSSSGGATSYDYGCNYTEFSPNNTFTVPKDTSHEEHSPPRMSSQTRTITTTYSGRVYKYIPKYTT